MQPMRPPAICPLSALAKTLGAGGAAGGAAAANMEVVGACTFCMAVTAGSTAAGGTGRLRRPRQVFATTALLRLGWRVVGARARSARVDRASAPWSLRCAVDRMPLVSGWRLRRTARRARAGMERGAEKLVLGQRDGQRRELLLECPQYPSRAAGGSVGSYSRE